MKSNTIRLLLMGVRDEDGAHLTSIFRRIGYASRIESARDSHQLVQALSRDSCDLVVLNSDNSPLDADSCAEQIVKSEKDVPLILVGDTDKLNRAKQPAVDIVDADDLERLAHSCLREYRTLAVRRQLADQREKLRQSEERNALLLSQTDEAIAYVADGMVINTNEHFSRTFGYDSTAELDCTPLIDLIHIDDQDRVKNALKGQAAGKTTRLSVKAVGADDREFSITLSLQQAKYDGEDCIQLSVGETSTDNATVSAVDPATGFANAPAFLEELQDVVQHGLGGSNEGVLMLVSPDRFHTLRSQLGLQNAQLLIADLADMLRAEAPDLSFGRVGDDLIAAIWRDVDTGAALKKAKRLCRSAEKRIVELDGQSQQYTVTISITAIVPLNAPSAEHLLDIGFGACENIRHEAGGAGNDAGVYVRQRQRLKRSEKVGRLIEEARADQRLQLLFQPLVSLAEDEGDHYEVLLDLREQEEDEISGMEMLAAVERQADGNTELDRWIIVESTKRLAETHNHNSNTRLIINLTCNVFQDKSLLPWLKVALKAAELPANSLIFQFNAICVSNHLKAAKDFSRELQQMGCLFTVRGHGSSVELAQVIKQLNPAYAKIDNALHGKHRLSTEDLRATINTVRSHGAKAIVPGVDSAATLAALWQMQPDYIQGKYVHDASTEMDYEFADIA